MRFFAGVGNVELDGNACVAGDFSVVEDAVMIGREFRTT
jgi:hypothetical protein